MRYRGIDRCYTCPFRTEMEKDNKPAVWEKDVPVSAGRKRGKNWMSSLSRRYLCITFAIMLICWGICFLCGRSNLLLNENYWLYLPYLLGGLSPTIASFIVLKRSGRVKTLKEWIRNIFDFRHSLWSYAIVLLMAVLYMLPQCLISGYEKGAPLPAILFIIPMMVIGGGLAEAGWRYLLQPELEEKYSFTIATVIIGLIWWLWHMPLFYIPGVAQYGMNYLAFGISVMGMSFALACIRKSTGSVWLCVLFHAIANSLSGVYLIHENIMGNTISSVILIAAVYLLLFMKKRIK